MKIIDIDLRGHLAISTQNSMKQHSTSLLYTDLQFIPKNMYTVFALLCFVVVIHWLIFPYPSGLLHWHCGNLTIAPVPAKQPWWIWINTSCEFIMNDCIITTKQSTAKPCAYFLGYTVLCCGYTLTDFPISIRLTSLALWQSNDCPSASKATLMNTDKYFMWIHYERLHNHNKAKHSKTVCIFLGIYCTDLGWPRGLHIPNLLLLHYA